MAKAATASLGTFAFGNESTTVGANQEKFNLKYAPAFNAFPELTGEDPIDFIRFCNDQGFRAIFDNNLRIRWGTMYGTWQKHTGY